MVAGVDWQGMCSGRRFQAAGPAYAGLIIKQVTGTAPHCMVLPPGEFNDIYLWYYSHILPVYCESFMTVAVAVSSYCCNYYYFFYFLVVFIIIIIFQFFLIIYIYYIFYIYLYYIFILLLFFCFYLFIYYYYYYY